MGTALRRAYSELRPRGAHGAREVDVALVAPRILPDDQHVVARDRDALVVAEEVGVAAAVSVGDLHVRLEALGRVGRPRVPGLVVAAVAEVGPRDVHAPVLVDGDPR